MFNAKTHDILRKLQLIFAAVAGALGIITTAIDLGKTGLIVTTIISALSYFVGQLAQSDSNTYFDTKSIVDKVVPDEEVIQE